MYGINDTIMMVKYTDNDFIRINIYIIIGVLYNF